VRLAGAEKSCNPNAVGCAAREVGGYQRVEALSDFLGNDVFGNLGLKVALVVGLNDPFDMAVDGLFEQGAQLCEHGRFMAESQRC